MPRVPGHTYSWRRRPAALGEKMLRRPSGRADMHKYRRECLRAKEVESLKGKKSQALLKRCSDYSTRRDYS